MLSSLQHISFPKNVLIIILIAGLLHGLLYYVIIPPWWHFDEPGHFEYAWLAANRPSWPAEGEYDATMRLEMARSMQKYGWYSFRNYAPNFSDNQPPWIGATQTGDKPAYYFLVSLPLRLLHNVDITVQYDVARFVSLLLYLLIILAAWKAMGEFVPEGHPLQWIVTGFIALLPAFVDEMVSVNNDVGAVLASSLFLWFSLRLVKRGISLTGLAYFALALALCYLTKSTAWYALLVAPLVLILSLLHGRYAWFIWVLTAIGLVAIALFTLGWENPTGWYQSPAQSQPLRVQTSQAPLGNYAFQIDYSGGRMPGQTGQFLGQQLIKSLRGETLTLGIWAWADAPTQAMGPSIRFMTTDMQSVDQPYGPLELNSTPFFYRVTAEVPSDANHAIVIPPYPAQPSTAVKIYFDAIVLAEGQYSDTSPHFNNSLGTQGIWDGRAFNNLIQNGSAEQGSLGIRPWVDRKLSPFLLGMGYPSFIFSTLQDWQETGWYYRGVTNGLLLGFWSYLAGGHLGLPGSYSDNFLTLVTYLGLAGACLSLWRKRKSLRWDIVYILGVSFILVWGIASLRGASSLLLPQNLYPWARYAYPAILPTALLLCVGWLELSEVIGSKLNLSKDLIQVLPIALMLGIALFTLLNIIDYFHPSLTNIGFLVFLVGLQYLAFRALSWGVNKLRSQP